MSAAGRTWDDDGGPMVEPPPDQSIAARAAAIRDDMTRTPAAAEILARQGRQVSDRLADEAQRRAELAESSRAVAEHFRGRPNMPSYVAMAQTRATWDGCLDERQLARELGRDRLDRMCAVLDEDDTARAVQHARRTAADAAVPDQRRATTAATTDHHSRSAQ